MNAKRFLTKENGLADFYEAMDFLKVKGKPNYLPLAPVAGRKR